MKTKYFMVLLLTLLVLTLFPKDYAIEVSGQVEPDVFVGVHLGYGDVAETMTLIDRTSSFTNMILIGTSKLYYNAQKLTAGFQYAYDRDLYLMSFAPSLFSDTRDEFLEYANLTWGDRILGFYAVDEPGGHILDGDVLSYWLDEGMPSSPAEAAEDFAFDLGRRLHTIRSARLAYWNYPVFTADYGLYWFDYRAGYDGLFAEFVANYSRQMTVSLVRGAAQVQRKQWGVLIGWKYDCPPYLASGEELFEDMVFAYESGAKYILIYDANEGWTEDILQEEHIDAMQRFWQYVKDNPRGDSLVSERSALVLPGDYGCGFRWPGDKLWGLFNQGLDSETINLAISNMLEVYGEDLDVIFDDDLSPFSSYGYSQLIRWDDPEALSTPTPTATPTPPATPSPSLSPEPTSNPDNNFSIPLEVIVGIAAIVIIIIALVGIKLRK